MLCIYRDKRFSPNSVEKDQAILDAVSAKLRAVGHEVDSVEEALWQQEGQSYPLILSMGRLPETLRRLSDLDACIINTPQGVTNCARRRLQTTMEAMGIPMAPGEGTDGYWLKRGDAAAQSHEDVAFFRNKTDLEAGIRRFRERGIDCYTVSAHVRGDLVKFYGVKGTGFFRHYYPTDDGQTKFGDEQHNGAACHHPFDVENLRREAERLAEATGVAVYGGDCIVCEDGSWCMIDFNDWPSFSRCREEAATAIVRLVEHHLMK